MAVPVIAQRTRRIRVGTAVTLLPLHHPLTARSRRRPPTSSRAGASSSGWAAAPSPPSSTASGSRLENRARFDEASTSSAWRGRRTASATAGRSGRSTTSRSCPGRSSSRTRPSGSPCTRGELRPHRGPGLPIYSGTTTTPLPQLRECMAVYRRRLAAAGHTWRDDQMALMFPMHVGATGGAARDAMRPACSSTTGTSRRSSRLPTPRRSPAPPKTSEETIANLPYEKFCRDQASSASRGGGRPPAGGAGRVRALPDHRLVRPGVALPRGEVERTMRRFAEQVMPKLG